MYTSRFRKSAPQIHGGVVVVTEDSERDSSHNADDDDTGKHIRTRRGSSIQRMVAAGAIVLVFTTTTWFHSQSKYSTTLSIITTGSLHAKQDHGLTPAEIFTMRTVSVKEDFNNHIYKVSPTAAIQIDNYKKGTAIIANIHFTHHGGTYVCNSLGRALGQAGSPTFACMGVREEDNVTNPNFPSPKPVPWTKENATTNIKLVRPHFHFLNWEFGAAPEYPDPFGRIGPPMADGDWDNPNLVSVFVAREPLSRLLAVDAWVEFNHRSVTDGTATRKEWMDYATTPHNNTNNFALAILAGAGCCQGNETEAKHLVKAKQILSKMTFVLDIECLAEGMKEVAHLLGFEPRYIERRLQEQFEPIRDLKLHRKWPPVKERIPPRIYDFLVDRNRLDIELYEWCKEISLVRCADVRPAA